jgi:hypothetical protein
MDRLKAHYGARTWTITRHEQFNEQTEAPITKTTGNVQHNPQLLVQFNSRENV